MNIAQILSVVGLVCEFLVVLATAWRVFLRKGKAKDEEIKEIGKPISKRILSERDYQAWVFALLFAGFLLQIVGILLEQFSGIFSFEGGCKEAVAGLPLVVLRRFHRCFRLHVHSLRVRVFRVSGFSRASFGRVVRYYARTRF